MLTRAAAAHERLRLSDLTAPRRSKRIREMTEAKATNVRGATKTAKRTSNMERSEAGRKGIPAVATSRITKTAKPRFKRTKKVDASRVLRAAEEDGQRLRGVEGRSSPENNLTNPNLPMSRAHDGAELIDEDMTDAEKVAEVPPNAELPGSALPEDESVNPNSSRHRYSERAYSAGSRRSASPTNEFVIRNGYRDRFDDRVRHTRPPGSASPGYQSANANFSTYRYDDRIYAGRTAEQGKQRVSGEYGTSLPANRTEVADLGPSQPLYNKGDELGNMFHEEQVSSNQSDQPAPYAKMRNFNLSPTEYRNEYRLNRSRDQNMRSLGMNNDSDGLFAQEVEAEIRYDPPDSPQPSVRRRDHNRPPRRYRSRPYQLGDRWKHLSATENDSHGSFLQGAEGEHPRRYDRSYRPARARFSREQFPQALFGVVIAQRALRRKRIQLQDCRQNVEEARFMVEMYQKGTTFVPGSEHEWRIEQAIREQLVEWKTDVSQRQEIESKIRRQVQHLEHRAARELARLQRMSSPIFGDQQLQYLSENNDFWETFDKCQATAETLAGIEFELQQIERDRDDIDDAIDRNYGPSPDFGDGVPKLSSTVWERDQDEHMAGIPELLQRHEGLQLEKKTAEALREEQWTRLTKLAEDALVGAKALEALTFEEPSQEHERQECEVPKHRQETAQQEATVLEQVEAPESGNAKKDLRQTLLVAKEACRKARDAFEGARDLTRAEIAELPQPVTEDDLGAARFQKLGRLSRALTEAENVYRDARKQVQRAGLARPAEQTSDFSNHSDDGFSESQLKEVVDQSRERILKMQHWNGLDMESARSMSPDIHRPAHETLMALPDVRVGEDSFECTEATGRTRERIDTMEALSRSIREQGDVPMADADSIIYDPEDEEL